MRNVYDKAIVNSPDFVITWNLEEFPVGVKAIIFITYSIEVFFYAGEVTGTLLLRNVLTAFSTQQRTNHHSCVLMF
jgi:hypothetical protein